MSKGTDEDATIHKIQAAMTMHVFAWRLGWQCDDLMLRLVMGQGRNAEQLSVLQQSGTQSLKMLSTR